jgi:hemerythrin-like domain-containing protein
MNGYVKEVSRALDKEHRATLDLLDRVERVVRHAGPARDPELVKLVGVFCRHVEMELERHFAFEENELFPRMKDSGDGDMAELLREEHEAIHAVAHELLPLGHEAAMGKLGERGWDALRRATLEMSERLRAHIDKETMALLPLVDDLLDDNVDRELAFAYATG